uniref:Uncharacterized protein n=1 Tax=Zea mays TaxID=4577 RepID=A0A804QSW5_MAIZE
MPPSRRTLPPHPTSPPGLCPRRCSCWARARLVHAAAVERASGEGVECATEIEATTTSSATLPSPLSSGPMLVEALWFLDELRRNGRWWVSVGCRSVQAQIDFFVRCSTSAVNTSMLVVST